MLPLLSIRGLAIDFITEDEPVHAVKGLSLEVHRNQVVALVGESGSGKSVTSLSLLKLLPSPPAKYSSGEILFSEDGKHSIDLLRSGEKALRHIRGNRIGMIFQEPMSSLNPVMSCGRQVAESLLRHKKITSAQARAEAIHWFERVKLPHPTEMYNRFPHQISGGQKQRVMIAMAMCCRPALLVCDEPTTALDVTVQKSVLELIRELQQDHQMGVVFITHDLGVVSEIAGHVAIMYRGEIVEQGDASAIFREAAHPYTRALIACRPALHPRGEPLPVVADYMKTGEPEKTGRTPHKTLQGDTALLEVKDLVVRFPAKTSLLGRTREWFTAVDRVSFEVRRGETLGLVGESGCGKSTLGRALLQLVMPSSGSIRYEGRDIRTVTGLHRHVQLVFQDPFSSLNPRLTIGDAIAEPMLVSGKGATPSARRKKVAEMLERVSLSPAMLNRYPHEFSGGQRQRIVIARSLSVTPDFLVCDESVSALDVSVQAQVLNLLNELKAELGLTLLFISHDLSVVRYMSDRIMVMRQGRIVESGDAEDVYNHPADEYTRLLIAAIPGMKPD